MGGCEASKCELTVKVPARARGSAPQVSECSVRDRLSCGASSARVPYIKYRVRDPDGDATALLDSSQSGEVSSDSRFFD